MTKGSEFSRLYEESRTMKKGERRQFLFENMRKYFRSDTDAKSYVEKKLQDRHRAMIARRIRFTRKAHLNDFNYFVTFTYADEKHTEDSCSLPCAWACFPPGRRAWSRRKLKQAGRAGGGVVLPAVLCAAVIFCPGPAPRNAAGGTVSRFFRAVLCAAPEGSDSPLYRVVL